MENKNKKKIDWRTFSLYTGMAVAPIIIWWFLFDIIEKSTKFSFVNPLLTSILVAGLFGWISMFFERAERDKFDKLSGQIESIHDIIEGGTYNVRYKKSSSTDRLEDGITATKSIFLSLTSGISYVNNTYLEKMLSNKKLKSIRIMLAHPQYATELEKIFNIEGEFQGDIKRTLKKILKIKQELDNPSILQIRLMKFLPYSSFLFIDKEEINGRVYATHYNYGSSGSSDSPTVRIDRNTTDGWYNEYMKVVETMWNSPDTVEITEESLTTELKNYFTV